MKRLLALFIALACALAPLFAGSTAVPGHQPNQRTDKDGNGIPDAGVYVVGHYYSVYEYDAAGKYWWDLGDGRVLKNVATRADLDQSTLTTLEYVVNYRADFGNTPYMDKGSIQNHIKARGYDYPKGAVFYYLIVHKSDPRYTGDPAWKIWGDWEYFVNVESGSGNLPRLPNYTG